MKKTIIIILTALMVFSASALADNKPAGKSKAEIKEVTFKVHLDCASCVKKVQENIAFEKGVKDLHICMQDQLVSIKYNASKTSEETLKAAIEKLGYAVHGKVEAGHEHHHGEQQHDNHKHGNHQHGGHHHDHK